MLLHSQGPQLPTSPPTSPTVPKAVNIIRPSAWQRHSSSYSSCSTSSSSPSTISTLSGGSGNTHRLNTTLFNTLAPFQASPWFKSTPMRQNFFRVLPPHRPDLEAPDHSQTAHGQQAEDDDDDYDSIDGDTDDDDRAEVDDDDENDDENDINDIDSESDDDNARHGGMKIVAKVKNGTIMNGRGELVNRVNDEDARANRKIADLEIEKASLLTLNATLESKVKQQADRIAELEKQLHMNDWPLSPVSEKDMGKEHALEQLLSNELTEDEVANDLVFQRLRTMLMGLIEQAEVAVRQKSKATGRVLTNYTRVADANQPMSMSMPMIQPMPSIATCPRKRTSMQRSLSRQSSPAVMVTTTSIRPASPTQNARPMQRSFTARPKSVHAPKWYN
ncbi:hypothetical protein BC940DRAFT_290386 [Gongronella butleri]|nr:hypothetical protein BC940DRAFT_290386 [Gongronella butleri]